MNIDVWAIINAIQIARCVTIMNYQVTPNYRDFMNKNLGIFNFLFSVEFLPYDILLNSKEISWEFSEFGIVSEMFLIIILDGVALLIAVVGFFIVLLAIFECCRPTGKSRKCQWVHKYMRICVEYITFNAFLRWFHEFSLTFFISAMFNLRINPGY